MSNKIIELIEKYKELPKQGSELWKKDQAKTIGGCDFKHIVTKNFKKIRTKNYSKFISYEMG